MAWKKIESAPMDGSHILLAIVPKDDRTGYVCEGYYEDGRGWYFANTHWTDYTGEALQDVTHWQPLPKPPRGVYA